METLRKPGGAPALDTAQTHQASKQIFAEPVQRALTGEVPDQVIALLRYISFAEGHEEIGMAEIAVVLGDLIFENEMIAEGVPGQLGQHPMVLVAVMAMVGENDIRGNLQLQRFEPVLDFTHGLREVTIPEIENGYFRRPEGPEQLHRAVARFLFTLIASAEYHPVDVCSRRCFSQTHERSATANFNIVAMGADEQNAGRPGSLQRRNEVHHDGVTHLVLSSEYLLIDMAGHMHNINHAENLVPDLPGPVAQVIEPVERDLVLEGVHGSPETMMPVRE